MSDDKYGPGDYKLILTCAIRGMHGAGYSPEQITGALDDFRDHCVAEAVKRVRKEQSPTDRAALDAARMLIPIGGGTYPLPFPPAAAAPCVDGHATGVARVDRSAGLLRVRAWLEERVDRHKAHLEEHEGDEDCADIDLATGALDEARALRHRIDAELVALPAPPAATAGGFAEGVAAARAVVAKHEDREFRRRDNEFACYARKALHDVCDEIDQLADEPAGGDAAGKLWAVSELESLRAWLLCEQLNRNAIGAIMLQEINRRLAALGGAAPVGKEAT